MDHNTADEIRRRFEALDSKGALIDLINYTRKSFHPKRDRKIPLRSLTYYADHRKCPKRYNEFTIKKKNGGERVINTPVKGLKEIQRALNAILSRVYMPHQAAYGFVPKRSIVDAAREHAGMKYVFCTDLKDFFQSIGLYRVKSCLMMPPFSLNNEEREPLAYLIANLCCDVKEDKPVLPQGAPTSPILSNIVCGKLDRRLTGLAKRFGLKYTRYADDLSFSGMENVFQKEREFREELTRIVEGQGFAINEGKTRLQKRSYRQEVCGLVVNREVNVRKRYVKEIRRYLHFWEILGKEKAEEIFIEDFGKDKPHWIDNRPGNRKGIPSLENYLNGKLLFLKMVKGDKNEQCLKLRGRFLSLSMPELSEQMRALSKIEFQLKSLLKEESLNEKEAKKITIEFKEIWQNINKEKIYSTPQLKQIKRIEEKLLKLRIQTDDPTAYREEGKRHDPERLVDLLFKHFSGKDSALKFSVHEWDKGRHEDYFLNHKEFTRAIDREWYEMKDDFFRLNKNLATLFYRFLIVKNKEGKILSGEDEHYKWGSEHVSTGWRSTELEEWCEKNPDEQPSSFKLPETFETSDKKECRTFADVINLFRGEFQFRNDIENFREFFLKETKSLREQRFKVRRNNIEEVKVYTNVQAFRNAVSHVFNGIKSHKEQSKEVEISTAKRRSEGTETKRDYLEVIILHVDSTFDKDSGELLEAKKSGDFKTIHVNLWNVCDWSVEARCKNGNFRFNYLTSYSGVKDYDKIEDPGGFKHVFRFYLPAKDE